MAAERYVVLDCCAGKGGEMVLLGLSKLGGGLKTSDDAVRELGRLLLKDSGCIEFISSLEDLKTDALLDRNSSVGAYDEPRIKAVPRIVNCGVPSFQEGIVT